MGTLLTQKAIRYTLFVLTLSWGAAALFVLSGERLGQGIIGFGFPVVYMFFPLIVSYYLYKKDGGDNFREHIGFKFRWNRWFVLAWLGPIVVTFIILVANLAIPGVSFSWEMSGIMERFTQSMSADEIAQVQASMDELPIHPLFLTTIQAIFAGITINAVAAFGEEAGWRGYLFAEFENQDFWRASLLIGTIWGIWHAPLIAMGHNYPEHPYIGIVFMTIWTILLTPAFLLIRQKSGSVLAPAILHGSLNASAGIPIMMLVGGNDLLNSWTGLSGFVVLIFVNIGIYLYLKKVNPS